MPEPITPMVHSVVSRLAEEARARAQRHRDKVGAVAMRIGELWANTWRPEIEAHFRFWDSFDLEGADWPLVHAHLEETLIRAGRLRDLHSLFGPPMWFAIHEFETFYCDLFPTSTRLDAHRRLQGFDNKTRAWPRAVALEPAGSSVAGCATHPD